MYMAPGYPPVTDLTTLRDPYPPKNGPKRSFLGPNFCLRSKFERIIEKSQIFFKFRADFRKKVCKKGVKTGGFGEFPCFTLFPLFYPILPYVGLHLGVWRLNLGLRAKARGLKATRRWGGYYFGTAASWGPATSREWRDPPKGSDVPLILGTAPSLGMA